LINPRDSDFDLTWHRDSVPAETEEEKEKEILKIEHYGTQWNTYVEKKTSDTPKYKVD
jgi:hypothetical protein